jgi:hypothetical protein
MNEIHTTGTTAGTFGVSKRNLEKFKIQQDALVSNVF